MKKILSLAIAAAVALSSCNSMLDTENYTGANTANFPAQASDLNAELSALYSVLNQYCNDPLQTPYLVYNIMSDDCNGAGGTGDVEAHAIGHLMKNKDALYDGAFKATYVGVARANTIIYSVDAFDWTGKETMRNQLLGEAYFMRGLFYLWGTQFWGDIPAYWAAAAPDPCPQQSAEDVIYPHILADFYSAYQLMSYGYTTQGDGHATKGAAAGYLARAYMFYQGFYKKQGELAKASCPDVKMLDLDEGIKSKATNETLTKSMVTDALKDAVANGGYELVEDFRLLWQYTNQYTVGDYKFTEDLAKAGKSWAGNGNKEEVFQIQFGNFASWNGTVSMGYTNMSSLYCSLRCDEGTGIVSGANISNGGIETFPFAQGWGQGTINAGLWDDWSNSDPRKAATILNVQDELADFAFASSCSEDAGLYNKKLMAVTTKTTAGNDKTSGPYIWGGVVREEAKQTQNNKNSMQGDHYGDIVLMRYSDILLMLTELTGDVSYQNKVRARAGLKETTYSWEGIQDERRFEFAGEGLRFNDLRRWSGKGGGENCIAAKALQKQEGTRVNYTGRWTVMKHAVSSWAKRYAETDGFLMIPPSQINIVGDETVLKQNAGWTSDVADANMSGTPVY